MVLRDAATLENISLLAGWAADTWQGGLSGEHQLRGVCQDGARPIDQDHGGEGGGGEREGSAVFARGRNPSRLLALSFVL